MKKSYSDSGPTAQRSYRRFFAGLTALAVVALCATSCQFRQDPYVDFTDMDGAKNLKFKVIGQHETDLSQGLPTNCYLPGGTPVYEWDGMMQSPR